MDFTVWAPQRQQVRVREHFAHLASRVKTAGDAKRLAQAIGRSAQGTTKESILAGLEQAVQGRIDSYVRPLA